MSEHRPRTPNDTTERFLRHLTGIAAEDERQAFERAVLEDDELFHRLTEVESQLVDDYVDGTLDEETTRHLASLFGTSSRLQTKAETTLALASHQAPPAPRPKAPSEEPEVGRSRQHFLLGVGGLVIALIVWLLVQVAGQRAVLRELQAENRQLREDSAAFEETVDQLEASNRALARRLARLEAETRP
ncbi:MAG: hypothetical protein AAF657_30250 [Acidobacteriota bacterium]